MAGKNICLGYILEDIRFLVTSARPRRSSPVSQAGKENGRLCKTAAHFLQ
jgi:hypothetical protein